MCSDDQRQGIFAILPVIQTNEARVFVQELTTLDTGLVLQPQQPDGPNLHAWLE